jgi:hypothetical protein
MFSKLKCPLSTHRGHPGHTVVTTKLNDRYRPKTDLRSHLILRSISEDYAAISV